VNYSRGREIVAGALRPASLFHEEKSSIQERSLEEGRESRENVG